MTLQRDEERPAESEHPMMRFMREIDALQMALAHAEQAAASGGLPVDGAVHDAAGRLLASALQVTTTQLAATEVTAHANRDTFHWVLTLSGIVDGRQKLVGAEGTDQPAATDTRASVCERLVTSLRAKTEQETGKPFLDVKVLFFDLQPNALPLWPVRGRRG